MTEITYSKKKHMVSSIYLMYKNVSINYNTRVLVWIFISFCHVALYMAEEEPVV